MVKQNKYQPGDLLLCFWTCLTIILFIDSCVCEPLVCKTFKKVDSLDDKSCKSEHLETSVEQSSEISCLYSCSRQHNSAGVFYRADDGACKCCSEHYITQEGLPTEVGAKYYTNGPDPGCANYLVTGLYGVADNQLTESGYWCQDPECARIHNKPIDTFSATDARLNTDRSISWVAPADTTLDEYVQVEFLQTKIIVGIVLEGRIVVSANIEYRQFVTRFKVLISLDCVNFTYITECDNVKIFEGNKSADDTVTRYFPGRARARCVRINPVETSGGKALRFDVLGCLN